MHLQRCLPGKMPQTTVEPPYASPILRLQPGHPRRSPGRSGLLFPYPPIQLTPGEQMLALPVVLPRLDLATLYPVPQGVTRQNQAVFLPEIIQGAGSRQVVLSHNIQ